MADLKAMALILGGMLLAFPALASPVCATDDLGKEICLEQPAERIAALSPGATELAWAAGAGDLVGPADQHRAEPAAHRAARRPLPEPHPHPDGDGLRPHG